MQFKKKKKSLTYDQQYPRLTQFINQFEDNGPTELQQCYSKYGRKKYLVELQKLANRDSKVIEIVIQDLQQFFRKDDQMEMVQNFRSNTIRYIRMFQRIVSEMLPVRSKQLNPQQQLQEKYSLLLKQQREFNYQQNRIKTQNELIPFRSHKNYDVSIVYGKNPKGKVKSISELKAQNIGELIVTRAIVVRMSDVKPELIVGTFACDVCGFQNYMEIKDSNFTPMKKCLSSKCNSDQVNGNLTFLPGHSKFRSYQESRIQQTPEQLRRGAVPKSTSLEIRGNLTNTTSPGDIVTIQGIVMPRQNKKNFMVNDLYFDSYIQVTKITREKKKYTDLNLSEEQKEKIYKAKSQMSTQMLFDSLAKSIAPQIYGLDTVKKALLLQMASGVTVSTIDNLKIRGQINIALFGDPGIAKSQLLKHISYISPRAVYTTGKGSSGVGLTAAVVADPISKELSLEAGALVLADMGVCCIDEFDKMQQNDRTAIHQVMEQQTVSITKAGIITTLNARTAVLAAANPVYGRYNKEQSIQKNLNMPAALLSRFDLIFVLLDKVQKKRDQQLSMHIGQVHQKKQAKSNGVFDEQFLKTYISMAKQYQPIIPEGLHDEMISKYIKKRQIQMDESQQGDSYTTMRSLLAIIRLSQAKAKLRFSNQVCMDDVLDCLEIVLESQASVAYEHERKLKLDPTSCIYEMAKTMCHYDIQTHRVQRIQFQNRAITRGFSKEQIQTTIKHYELLGVLAVDQTYITLYQ